MGLFSSREVTVVGTSVSRVMEDDRIADSSKIAVIKAIIKNGNISEYLLDGMMSSVGTRAERMYEYGQSEYAYGLPSGEYYSATQGSAQIQSILDALEGTPITLEYTRLTPANTLHMGWMKLVNDYGYNSATNELVAKSTVKGFPVYLKDMVVQIPASQAASIKPQAIEQWGIAPKAGHVPTGMVPLPTAALMIASLVKHSAIQIQDNIATEQVKVTYAWDANGVIEESFTLPITGFNPNADYFHVKYTVAGQAKYWMYQIGLGTYPSLDILFNAPPTLVGEYFPMAYFRLNKQPVNAVNFPSTYPSVKKLVKYLGMDFDAIREAIHENPDIEDVEQAIMVMAVPANSTHALDQQYLYEYFDRLHLTQDNEYGLSDFALIQAKLYGWERSIEAKATVIQDQAFKMSLSNGGIFKRRKGGVVAARGKYASGFEEKYDTYTANTGGDAGMDYEEQIKYTCHYYRKQITDSMYDEIEVINLRTTYHVYEDYESIGDGAEEFLLVPVDRTLTASYSTSMKEQLYSRSLHYVINSRTVTKLAWYQQAWFADFVFFVAVALAILSMGQSLVAAGALIATGLITVNMVLLSMMLAFLENALLALAISFVVKNVSPEIAIAIAVLYAAYSAFGGFTSTTATFAENLLSASSGVIRIVQESLKAQMGQIQAGFQSLTEEAAKTSELISKAQDLLENDTLLSPLTIIGESADDYYRRTMYSGNVGIHAINSIETYVDRALTLPTLSDSFGDLLNPAN